MEIGPRSLKELKRTIVKRIDSLLIDRAESGRVRYLAWNWGYLGRAATALYASSRDAEILALILNLHDTFASIRDDHLQRVDDKRHRLMKAWSNVLRPDESAKKCIEPGLRSCEVECTGLILLPFTDLLLRTRREMLSDEVRQKLIGTIVDAVDAHLPDLVEHAPSDGAYFVSPWTKEIEPLNHSHLFGAAAAEAYALTGAERFKMIAQKLYNFFKANWHWERNDTISWNYCPSQHDSHNNHAPMEFGRKGFNRHIGAEFVDKASMTLELPVAMHRVGLLSDEDLKGIAMSLSKNIFLPRDRLNLYIGPRKIRSCNQIPKNFRSHHLGSYDLLAPFHPVIGKRLDSLVANRGDLFPRGWHSGAALDNGQRTSPQSARGCSPAASP